MKLSQVKALLPTLENVTFKLENGSFVPEHFHVTEVGMVIKNFIDCGGVIRTEKTVNSQSKCSYSSVYFENLRK